MNESEAIVSSVLETIPLPSLCRPRIYNVSLGFHFQNLWALLRTISIQDLSILTNIMTALPNDQLTRLIEPFYRGLPKKLHENTEAALSLLLYRVKQDLASQKEHVHQQSKREAEKWLVWIHLENQLVALMQNEVPKNLHHAFIPIILMAKRKHFGLPGACIEMIKHKVHNLLTGVYVTNLPRYLLVEEGSVDVSTDPLRGLQEVSGLCLDSGGVADTESMRSFLSLLYAILLKYDNDKSKRVVSSPPAPTFSPDVFFC